MGVFEVLRFGLRRAGLGLADWAVTHPMFSWTWTGAGAGRFVARLEEFRPADAQTVIEMMEGKYLVRRSAPFRLAAAFFGADRSGRAGLRAHAGARLDRAVRPVRARRLGALHHRAAGAQLAQGPGAARRRGDAGPDAGDFSRA